MTRIPQRSRIFVGCEGESERGYSVFLQILAETQGLHVHIDAQIGGVGGGDHLSVVENSIAVMRRRERKARYAHRFILLDEDLLTQAPARTHAMHQAANAADVQLILQRWEHEALLLRHFDGYQTHQPPQGQGEARLKTVWPEYTKGMAAADIAKKLALPDVQRAGFVEPSLRLLLDAIGLP